MQVWGRSEASELLIKYRSSSPESAVMFVEESNPDVRWNVRIFMLDFGVLSHAKKPDYVLAHATPWKSRSPAPSSSLLLACCWLFKWNGSMIPVQWVPRNCQIVMPVLIRLKRPGAESSPCGECYLLSGGKEEGNETGERNEERALHRTVIQVREQMWRKLKVTRWQFYEQLKVTGTSFEYVHI